LSVNLTPLDFLWDCIESRICPNQPAPIIELLKEKILEMFVVSSQNDLRALKKKMTISLKIYFD
jgi:hypothetical protein